MNLTTSTKLLFALRERESECCWMFLSITMDTRLPEADVICIFVLHFTAGLIRLVLGTLRTRRRYGQRHCAYSRQRCRPRLSNFHFFRDDIREGFPREGNYTFSSDLLYRSAFQPGVYGMRRERYRDTRFGGQGYTTPVLEYRLYCLYEALSLSRYQT